MREFYEWIRQQNKNRPWLVLGKGPSLHKYTKINATNFTKIALNHTALSVKCDVCHVFDFLVISELMELWETTDIPLVVPEYLNEPYQLPLLKGTFHKSCRKSVASLLEENQLLYKLDTADRLFYYPLSNEEKLGVVKGSFSAATVINMLSYYGVTEIRTLGIDGGCDYADVIRSNEHRLEAGQESFDSQFIDIASTVQDSELLFGPVDMTLPIKIFVGTQKEQKLAYEVLKYSIEKYSSISVEVLALDEEIENRIPDYAQITSQIKQGTPFSLQRFCIPELCGYQGRAIYLDSDMQVFRDVRELITWPIGEEEVFLAAPSNNADRASQISVLLIDCEKADWNIRNIAMMLEAGEFTYEDIYSDGNCLKGFSPSLPSGWNSLEIYDKNETRLLHYTDMGTQPWLSIDNPHARIWCEDLLNLVKKKSYVGQMLVEHVDRGWIRPSLMFQMERNIVDPLLLPRSVRLNDQMHFLAPHLYGKSIILRGITDYGKSSKQGNIFFKRYLYTRLRYFIQISGVQKGLKSLVRQYRKVRNALSTGFRFGI